MTKNVFFLLFVLACAPLFSAELVVSPDGAPGTYSSIQEAIDAARGGDTVLIRKGIYRESLQIRAVYGAKTPLTVKAAPGARVMVTGFRPVSGWKEEGNGIFSAPVDAPVEALYVGYRAQQCARYPEDGTRLPLLQVLSGKRQFRAAPETNSCLQAVSRDVKNAILFTYFENSNTFGSLRLAAYHAASGMITIRKEDWSRWIQDGKHAYSLMNHPALISRPGHWAFVSDAQHPEGGGTVYFKPANAGELSRVQYPAGGDLIRIAGYKNPRCSGVILKGLEITGARGSGISISAEDVMIQGCIVHNNGGGGIHTRQAKRVKIVSNRVLANGVNGVSFASVEDVLVLGNEIAYQQMDGLILAGNISGKKTGMPGANPPSRNIQVRRNYIHHHFLQGHPDNIQMYRGVSNVCFEENLILWGGQSLMTEETEDVQFLRNVVIGSEACMLICGHENSDRWKFQGNTLWGGGYGFFSFTGKDYELSQNLLAGGGISYGNGRNGIKSGKNYFTPSFLGRTTHPWRTHSDLKKFTAQYGLEQESAEGAVAGLRLPQAYAIGHANGHSVDSIALRKGEGGEAFLPGDRIELNGDGILRSVTSSCNGILSFSPALPLPPFRGVMIANWKKAASAGLEVAQINGCGAPIRISDFLHGMLLKKGTVSLPPLPAALKKALPDPNCPVIPLWGL